MRLKMLIILIPSFSLTLLSQPSTRTLQVEPLEHQQLDEDRAGPYVIETLDKNRERKNGEIRDFIWSHWRQRRRGRLHEITYSKEGVAAETVFVIAPDEKGVWTLKMTTQWPSTSGVGSEHKHAEYTAYSVRRIEPRHDGQSPAVFIPEDKPGKGDSYWLVFYDLQYKEIGGR